MYDNGGNILKKETYYIPNGTISIAPTKTDNYDETGLYLGSSYGETKYSYTYDETGFVTGIGYGGTGATESVTPLLGYVYNDSSNGALANKITKKTYTNITITATER